MVAVERSPISEDCNISEDHEEVKMPIPSTAGGGISKLHEETKTGKESFLDKCIKVGRLGPLYSMIDEESIKGNYSLTSKGL